MIKIKEKENRLSKDDITSFIENLSSYSDEEITKWLKAVKEYGLEDDETSALILAMANSGEVLSWEGLEPTIDKHSTGGIGDKITLLFVPLLAACGVNVPKLSGRGLGVSGGTIDKLESISGFRTNLTLDEIKKQIKEVGLVVTGAMKNLAPADKRLYAIRDVTDTVNSIPLIASSVMSKKLASGSKNIILDVKFGSGAFMKSKDDAFLLAKTMSSVGGKLNRNIKCAITDMNEPLGYCIGNSLEIQEVLDVLSGKNVNDLVELTVKLAEEALVMAGIRPQKSLEKLLLGGEALDKFEKMISSQGGDLQKGFTKSNYIESVKSTRDSYIKNIDALTIGEVVHKLGAGREKVSDSIDYLAGIKLFFKHGDKVSKGDTLFEIHAKSKEDAENLKSKAISACEFSDNEPSKLKLVHEIL